MLDAYIIDRIRREREADATESPFVPLRIEVPEPGPDAPPPPTWRDSAEESERGTVIVDFTI